MSDGMYHNRCKTLSDSVMKVGPYTDGGLCSLHADATEIRAKADRRSAINLANTY
jgi:hypothetical protein